MQQSRRGRTDGPLRWVAVVAAGLLLAFPAGCYGPLGPQQPPPTDGGVGDLPPLPPETTAVLEILSLDIWGQALPPEEAALIVSSSDVLVSSPGVPLARIPLQDAGTFEITLSAMEHETLTVWVEYDGSSNLDGGTLLTGPDAEGHGIVFSHDYRASGNVMLPVHTVYFGLRHRWFSAQGRPARRGNAIDLLMDGEEAWSEVYEDLTAATDTILVSTWWWDSEFELIRDWNTHADLTWPERWSHTMMGILESSPADKRVLVGQFWGQDGILSWLTKDAALRSFAETPGDGFEFMGHANETEGVFFFEVAPFLFGDRVRAAYPSTIDRTFEVERYIASTVPPRLVDLTEWPVGLELKTASHHQKFLVIDWDVAYVGGMNVKGTDWDSSDHLVFDHRRMGFDASVWSREDVMNLDSMPDTGPRKDYMIRVAGPAAADVADVFNRRWAHLLSTGVDYAVNNTGFVVDDDIAAVAGGSQIQVTATLPDPFAEHAIAETWFNAIANAAEYIFIEDQYFRMPMVNDAISARMHEVPSLRLVVITKPVDEWVDPGCAWTYLSDELFETMFPGRYMTLQLRSFAAVTTSSWLGESTDPYFVDIDTHSKMFIVDDKFMSVGSANKNNRGIVYEGELNVAVLDAAWVRAARHRILANVLPPGTPPTNDLLTWWNQLADAAVWNDYVYDNWAAAGSLDLGGGPLPAEYWPLGFVYSLEFGTLSDCFFENVGPDMT